MKTFYIGVGLFSISTGFLIGASNTPILGAIITGILALATSIWRLTEKKDNEHDSSFGNIEKVGSILIVFSISLIIGVFSGEGYRRNWFKKETSDLLWKGLDKPRSAHEALDWLMIEKKLGALNYSKGQIKQLYEMYSDSSQSEYDIKRPYHIMLSNEELVILLKDENPFGPSELLLLDEFPNEE